jgi:peptide/nickel transport system permease protein
VNQDTKKKILRTFYNNRSALAGLIITIAVIVICLIAPFLPIKDPLKYDMAHRFAPPGSHFIMGADQMGRDILSRVIWGGRISILVGVAAVGLGLILGSVVGLVCGYKGGYLDNIIMRIVDVLISFPLLILGILFMTVLGGGMSSVIIAIGISLAPRFARLARGAVLSVKEKDFVSASIAMGLSDLRIMFRHILPNITGDLIVMGSLWVGSIILTEASMSFIGLGVPPPIPSWGRMVREGMEYLSHAPWVSIYTGLAIFITIISINMLGDGIRDILDPKLRR